MDMDIVKASASVDPTIKALVVAAHNELLNHHLDDLDYEGGDYLHALWHGTWAGIEAQMSQRLGFPIRRDAMPEWESVVADHQSVVQANW